MMERKARKSTVLVAVFALVGMIGIFAVSQAYGDDNTNLQATNANAYSVVPMTFSLEDLLQQMENANNNISNGTSNVDNQIVNEPIADNSEPGKMVDQAIKQYEKENPGKTITKEGRQKLLKLFYDDEMKNYSTAPSNNSLKSTENTNKNPNPNPNPNPNTYSLNLVQQAIESNPNMVVTEDTPNPNIGVSAVTTQPTETPNVAEPVIQNIETVSEPERNTPVLEQQVEQAAPFVEVVDTTEKHVDPLVSKAIEDNVAAAATVTNTEPVIIEKEPTRGAGLFGEDGIIAQIVSNPVLRAGIAAFPILIIILIAGFMISRRNEE